MQFDLPKVEEEIIKFWREKKIFQKSLKKARAPFIFYEGPPTANGRPGIHHILARSFKDIICRYKTMQGYYVPRKAGWDTHGLPVEIEVEKEIETKSKKDIENFGIGNFNKKCKESVWKYKKEWEDLTERIGFWLDMENPYITYQPEYMETLFWIVKQYWENDLLVEDRRVVPWCPRCQTSLSSHELAQGYKKVKENSIYVKFKIRNPKSEILKKLQIPNSKFQINSNIQYPISNNIYLLVWTTTPWTLPGNVAVAVNPEIDYVMIREQETENKERMAKEDYYILAKERLKDVFKDKSYEVIKNFRGEDLIKLEYDPPFNSGVIYSPQFHDCPYPMHNTNHKYRIIAGDFVSTEEGTGIVHIAPAFGEDDFKAGKENNLPSSFAVKEDGTMASGVIGEGKFFKDVDPLIIEDLRKRDLLFKEELYEHDYPFCWRCKSPLIYYLHHSWFLKTTKDKEKLLANNKKINWVPDYLKYGRFGKFLEEVRDWNFSRERYWGTPLPVWKCCECGGTEVIGSREDLQKQKFSKNKYFVLRHGLALTNVKGIVSALPGKKYSLTKIGKKQVKEAVLKLKRKLKEQRIDIIFSSDIERCKESAEIASKGLNAKIILHSKIREINVGIYEGKSLIKYKLNNPDGLDRFKKKIEGGESWNDCKIRMVEFIEEIEKNHQSKNILVVSHGDPIWLLEGAMEGFFDEELFAKRKKMIKRGEIREIEFKKFPINEEGEIDFHRPYIDEVKFYCSKCSGKMERVKSVIDCWFDSGAMPFAQAHWPFAWAQNKKLKIKNKRLNPPKLFPADYICEGVDQTRGWFYTLLAVSTLLGFENPYKNVISLGIVLDKKGQKMSKSRGNTVNPFEIIGKYGADSVRWYFFTINQPGEPKKFDENDLKKTFNRFILTLWNSYTFFETYRPNKLTIYNLQLTTCNILDKWILSRLQNLILFVSDSLNKFDVISAAREIERFVLDDLSNWHIRRSRRRFQKPKNEKELEEATNVLGFVLFELAKLTAPFIPFLSEKIYQEAQNVKRKTKNKKSVHLEDFPKLERKWIDKGLEEMMQKTREIVALALAERKKAGIKVRQPLQKLKVKGEKLKVDRELLDLIKEEINVKEVIFDTTIKNEAELDTEITPQLKEEGMIREMIREIQEMRKKSGLKKENKIEIFYEGDKKIEAIIEKNKNILKKETLSEEISQKENSPYISEKEIEIDGKKLNLKIR